MVGREKKFQMRERERERERESEGIYERETVNKQIIKIFETCYSVVSFMKLHCSMLQKYLRFGTSHEP